VQGALLALGIAWLGVAPQACSRTGLPVWGAAGGSGGMGSSSSSPGLCSAATTVKAQSTPLDLYIMLDQSGSMADEVAGGVMKWTAVTNAIEAFVNSPDATGVGVGIQYFAVPPGGSNGCPVTCKLNTDCPDGCGECWHYGGVEIGHCWNSVQPGGGGESCDAADYAVPEVEIGVLPENAQNIVDSMALHQPSTGTPTSAALAGAIEHAKDWAKLRPTHTVVDVLATDGDPTSCDTSIPDIEAIAEDGATQKPAVRTFVIGVGSSTSNLNGIAAAGGTQHAYIVDTNADTNAQFLAALDDIRHVALACSFVIPLPSTGNPDYSSINVQYSPGDGSTPEVLMEVPDVVHCPMVGNAWYYDNPKKPTEIILCKATCDKISGDKLGQVDVVLGCKSVE